MKNKILNSGFGVGNLIFLAALIIALPLRIYQYVGKVLEPGTGFFTDNHWSIYLLYGVIIISLAGIMLVGFMKRKELDFNTESKKNPVLGICSGLVAAGMIIDAYSCLDVLGTFKTNNFYNNISPERTSYYVILLQMAVSLIAALFFVILCIGSLTGKTSGTEYRIFSVIPVFWSILRMVARFMRTISYVRVSELLFEMLMLMLMIMFFMAFAQCNSRVNEKDCQWKIAAYGLPAALMALLCSVPRIILSILGSADIIYSESIVEFSDLAVALFIIAAVLTKVTVRLPEAAATPEENETVEASAEEITEE